LEFELLGNKNATNPSGTSSAIPVQYTTLPAESTVFDVATKSIPASHGRAYFGITASGISFLMPTLSG